MELSVGVVRVDPGEVDVEYSTLYGYIFDSEGNKLESNSSPNA
jgi:hypothetical protein